LQEETRAQQLLHTVTLAEMLSMAKKHQLITAN